jgi:hypothetical protein
MFQHRSENRQQLSRAGGERHFLRLPRSLQALIEDSDHRIELDTRNGLILNTLGTLISTDEQSSYHSQPSRSPI